MPEDSTLPRRQLGRYLREYREQAGMTIAQAAAIVEIGATTLQRLEKGTADKVRLRIVRAFCETYDVSPDETDAMNELAKQAAVKSWYHEYNEQIPANFNVFVGLEQSARHITSHQELVPGLLQTADYASTIVRSFYPDETEAETRRRVDLRLKRQALIKRKVQPVTLDMLLHESALRRVVGGPKVMAAQLRYLADASTWPNVTLRILPFAAGIPMGLLSGSYVIFDFGTDRKGQPVEPSVVYVESLLSANVYLEKHDDVQRYTRLAREIRRQSADPVKSRSLLRQVAKEYDSER